MKYHNYKDLEIYQLAHTLAVEIHQMTLTRLPKFEMYEEGSQIRRSSKSVPSTIVEGFGRRRYKNEFVRFLTYALSPCDETKEHLDLVSESGSLKDRDCPAYFTQKYDELGKKITRFTQSVETGYLGPKTRIKDPLGSARGKQGSSIQESGGSYVEPGD